jgi:hypothetical protein
VIDRAYRVSDRPLVIVLYGLERLLDDGRDRAADRKFVDALAVLVDLPIRGLQLVMAVPEVDLGAFRHLLRGHYRLLANDLRLHGDDRRLIIPIGFVGAGGTTVVAGAGGGHGRREHGGIGAAIAGGVLGVAGVVLAAVGVNSLARGTKRPRQRRRRPSCAPRATSARRARRSCRRRGRPPRTPRRIRAGPRTTHRGGRGARRPDVAPRGLPDGVQPAVDRQDADVRRQEGRRRVRQVHARQLLQGPAGVPQRQVAQLRARRQGPERGLLARGDREELPAARAVRPRVQVQRRLLQVIGGLLLVACGEPAALQAEDLPAPARRFVVGNEGRHDLFGEALAGRGGALLCVGGDHCYTLLALAGAEAAYLLDHDRRVVDLHAELGARVVGGGRRRRAARGPRRAARAGEPRGGVAGHHRPPAPRRRPPVDLAQ